MRIEYPDYYNKFHCLAGACPDTCCRDWEVDVDDDTFYYYKVQEGELGKKLEQCLREEKEFKYIPMREDGFCPFLTGKGLCELCCRLGEEGMCQVCQEYPRYYMGIGHYEQIDLSISCMEAGRLLFMHDGPIRYEKAEDEEEPWETLSAEDEKRLEQLLKKRDALIAALQEPEEGKEPPFALLPGREEDERLLEILSGMEILDTRSGELLQEIREHYEELLENEEAFRKRYALLLQQLFTRFAVYLVYRYTLDSYYEGNLGGEERLWKRSLRLLFLLCLNEERKFESPADAGLSNRSIGADAPAAAFGKPAFADFASARYKNGAFGMGTMIALAHRFSRQVEHSDENMERMKEE